MAAEVAYGGLVEPRDEILLRGVEDRECVFEGNVCFVEVDVSRAETSSTGRMQ